MTKMPTNQVLDQWLELLVYDTHLSQYHLGRIADAMELMVGKKSDGIDGGEEE